jgi:hypothetical protein
MNAFRDSAAQAFVFVVGVEVADAEPGALGVEPPTGPADDPVPPDEAAGLGEFEDEDVEPARLPDGEAPAPAPSSPGWHAVITSVAADRVAIARAALRTPGLYRIPLCMKSPDCHVQAPVAHRHSSLQIAPRPPVVHVRTGL